MGKYLFGYWIGKINFIGLNWPFPRSVVSSPFKSYFGFSFHFFFFFERNELGFYLWFLDFSGLKVLGSGFCL